MLGAMLRGEFNVVYDQNGCVFIDRDGHLFQYILNFLRYGRFILAEKIDSKLISAEADFYQIEPLAYGLSKLQIGTQMDALKRAREENNKRIEKRIKDLRI